MTLRELEIRVTGTNIRRTESDLARLEAQANRAAAAISNLSSNIRGVPRIPTGGRGGGGGGGAAGGGGGGAAGGAAANPLGGFASALLPLRAMGGFVGNLATMASGAATGLGQLVGGIARAGGAAAGSAGGILSMVSGIGALAGPIGMAVTAIGQLIGGGLNLLGNAFQGLIKIGGQVLGVIGNIVGGIIDMGVKAAETALQLGAMFAQQKFAEYVAYEQQVRGLAVYEDSAKSLMETLGRLRQLAKLPGLALPEVMKATVSLRAAGLGADTAEQSILGFARALGAVGKGKADFAGAMLALQQIVTAGKLEGDEIRQLSERVPQIRLVLMRAFGSAKGEDISKKMAEMGLSVVDVVKQINAELLKIPATSAGISTSLENVMDDLAEATRPVGQGLAMMFTAAMPGMNNFVAMIGEVSKGIGEVLGSLGKSGIIGEVLNTVGDAIKNALNVDSIQEIFVVALSYVSAFIQQLPAIIKEGFDFFTNLFDVLKPKIIDFANSFVFWIQWAVLKAKHFIENFGIIFKSTIEMFSQFSLAAAKFQEGDYMGSYLATDKAIKAMGFNDALRLTSGATIGELMGNSFSQASEMGKLRERKQAGTIIEGLFGDVTAGMKGAGLGGVQAEFGKIGGIAADFQERIRKGISPLAPLPEGLNYGGRPDESQIKPLPHTKVDTDNLKEIAANTKKTADSLSLRTQTIGGRDIAKIGVTGAEVQSAGVQTQGIMSAPSVLEEGLRMFYASEARKRGPSFAFRRF